MLRGIQFNSSIFDKKDDNNLMDKLTANTIILCENTTVRNLIAKEIVRILNHECESNGDNDYYCEPTDNMRYKYVVNYLPTTTLDVDCEQLITITVEAPYILTAKEPDDIWFASVDKDNIISIYPLKIFKGYKEVWEQKKTYQYVLSGRYGCYVRYANIT